MTKVATFYCDFSSQVKPHIAIYSIQAHITDGVSHAREHTDSCEKHLGQLINTLFNAGVKDLSVHINGEAVPKTIAGQSLNCDVEGCGFIGSGPQSLSMHKNRRHGMLSQTASAKRQRAS